jgi:hypothetical protein
VSSLHYTPFVAPVSCCARAPLAAPRSRVCGPVLSSSQVIRTNPTNRPTRAGSSNSSPGVFQRCPSIEILAARPLPDGKPPFGSKMPASSSFRPCRSSRLRRLPPRVPRRSVAPCTRSWGSVRFGSTTLNTPCGASNHVSLPRNRASHPSEPFPRPQPYRVTAALAPAPFPVATHRSARRRSDLEAWLRRRVRYRVSALPPRPTRCSPGLRSPSGFSPNSLRLESRRTGDPTSLELW